MAHTPGPWTCGRDSQSDWQIHQREASIEPLAVVRTEGDARVMTAAPELLAAAHAMVAALDETKYDVFIGSPADLQRLVEGRRGLIDAIANAEGL